MLLLITGLWGCGRPVTEMIVFLPDSADKAAAGSDSETVVPREMFVAVLPVENLSGTRAPVADMSRMLRSRMAWSGFRLLADDKLEQFRKKHRMRYTGGVGTKISQALRDETGIDAVLVTSLESFKESGPPMVSLISRLVSCVNKPEIIWMDSVGLSGDESPGILGLGLIRDPELLMSKAVRQLTASLTGYLDTVAAEAASGDDREAAPAYHWKRKYLPYDFFRSPHIDQGREYSIAVVPLLDLAVRKNAGRILSLHYVRELHRLPNFKVIEPGVVREELLRFRAIMPAGPSLAITDLITGPGSLGVDLVLSGRVFDYQDTAVNTKVDFSVQVLEGQSRRTVFGARTFSTGDKGVWFFDFGRVHTAHDLTREMTLTTAHLLTAGSLPRDSEVNVIALAPLGRLQDRDRAAVVPDAREKVSGSPYAVIVGKETGLPGLF